jgi:hypothetical protein
MVNTLSKRDFYQELMRPLYMKSKMSLIKMHPDEKEPIYSSVTTLTRVVYAQARSKYELEFYTILL